MSFAPGVVRDAIVQYLRAVGGEASALEITAAINRTLGNVPKSSVRSYLSLNTPAAFERIGRGKYRLRDAAIPPPPPASQRTQRIGNATLVHGDCFEWLINREPASVHAIVTDPPYGLIEYTTKETAKLRAGKGGVWRIPPSFDGHQRAPLPRFTVLTDADREALYAFFRRFGILAARVAVPGANILVASNPLLAHIVASAMSEAGLELRGYIARQVMTMRGGDRPKNAHIEFSGVSVMPRSQWEPWIVLRTPLDGRVQDNLRRWGTGGFRRTSVKQPFGDLIKSHPTPASEKKIAPHPSLKPQAFMRQLVRAVLPLEKGIVLDPFMGGGSTLAAANAIGYESIGIEVDEDFFELATHAVPRLVKVQTHDSQMSFPEP